VPVPVLVPVLMQVTHSEAAAARADRVLHLRNDGISE
jgi:predicted ABC-type transport system involved in lysophospholipase L1 biosynthesis ATPase subunit